MIYNQGMPINYMPQGYQFPYQQNMPNMGNQQMPQQMPTQQTMQPSAPSINSAANSQQIQNGGFVSVRSIDEARHWVVAPGKSVTFKIEGAPYVCEKTMGYSQLESPRFEIFRLVREDSSEAPENATQPKSDSADKPRVYALSEDLEKLNTSFFEIKADFEAIKADFDGIKGKFNEMINEKGNYNSNTKPKEKKSEVSEDE